MKRILRGKRPSPALLVSIVALALAATGTAIAGNSIPGKSTVNSADIKNGAVKRLDMNPAERTEWAFVDGGGGVHGHSGISSVSHAPHGVYVVTFFGTGPKNSVLDRGLAATLGPVGEQSGSLTLKIKDSTDTSATVAITDSRDDRIDHAFYIVLMPK